MVRQRLLCGYHVCLGAKLLQWCRTVCNPRDCSRQALLSMGFSRQKCWSGLPCPSPGDLPKPGIEPRSPALKADSLPSKPPGKPHGPRQVATYSLLSETLYAWLYICAGQMKEGCICVQDRLTQALVMYTSLVK